MEGEIESCGVDVADATAGDVEDIATVGHPVFGPTETRTLALQQAIAEHCVADLEKTDPFGLHPVIESCLAADAHQVFFGTWPQKLSCLTPAYELYLRMIDGGEEAVEAVLDHPMVLSIKPRTSSKKPALLAVRIVTRPDHPDDHKTASDYSAMLQCAEKDGVSASRFLDWATRATLRGCRKALSKMRRANKSAAEEDVADAASENSEEHQKSLGATEIEGPGAIGSVAPACLRLVVTDGDEKQEVHFPLMPGIVDELQEFFDASPRASPVEFLLGIAARLDRPQPGY
ncbi:hypothetical protein [Mesorhizobium sp. L103C105A0]|uniref:hypothetical protein n=1 Tax=Mesorhizobium sp. L103C105A0 TaxID=1287074 RepID=UPI0003CFC9D9|nr:hypothetical protein [Mesorhizobium sp. L103C105A0]ESZ78670.1 hypothetical protein X726_04175 [Mesorhizobium sp. L103C105A0]